MTMAMTVMAQKYSIRSVRKKSRVSSQATRAKPRMISTEPTAAMTPPRSRASPNIVWVDTPSSGPPNAMRRRTSLELRSQASIRAS